MTDGQIAFEAYAHSTQGKTFDGRVIPTWHTLPPAIKAAWEAAAGAVASEWRRRAAAHGCNVDGSDDDCA